MSLSTEIETKIEIDRAGFERLRSSCDTLKRVEQLNVYYDSSWLLASASATFRIRLSPLSEARMTLKMPESWDEGRRGARERELPLAGWFEHMWRSVLPKRIDVNGLPTEFQCDLSTFGIVVLARVGWVRNTRYVLALSGGTVELDRLRLPGGHDYFEVEIENDDIAVHRELAERVREVVPYARYSRMSKFERFREALDKMVGRGNVVAATLR